jgi:hypothetical protein
MSFQFLQRTGGADGILLPPGFQFPVKELVASLKDPEEIDNNLLF